jgi:hypothetical protein
VAIVKGKNANKPWTVRYRDSLGKQREKSFRTRREADQFSADQTKAKAYGSREPQRYPYGVHRRHSCVAGGRAMAERADTRELRQRGQQVDMQRVRGCQRAQRQPRR